MTSQIELPELDSGDVTTLEKVFLFSQSPLAFHKIFIVRSLAHYLKHGMRRNIKGSSDIGGEARSVTEEGSGAAAAGGENVVVDDRIQPSDAVKYVLPLLPILATDEGTPFAATQFSRMLPRSPSFPILGSDVRPVHLTRIVY